MSGPEQPPGSLFGSGKGKGNVTLGISIIVFMSIALYNAIELGVLIPLSFRRYRSLYFWSLLISSTLGVIPATIGPGMQYFHLAPLWLSMALSNIGFVMMVPVQSVVLYSRLHLVSQNIRVLHIVRWVIVFAFFFIVVPTVVLNIASTYLPDSQGWVRAFAVMERIQLTWFAAQESSISAVYIYDTIRLIQLSPTTDKRRHKILYELLAINITAIVMDLSLVILEYLGYYFTQVILKATVYSVKLKLEFAVLGMLVSMVHSHASEQSIWQADYTTSNFS